MKKIILKKILLISILIVIPSFIVGIFVGYSLKHNPVQIVQKTVQHVVQVKDNLRQIQKAQKVFPVSGPMMVITYDDGYEKIYSEFFPVHKVKGVPATLFMISGQVGQLNMLTWSQLHEMNNEPIGKIEIQDHTYSHPRLTKMTGNDLIAEFEKSIKTFADHGFKVSHLAYPWGDTNDLVKTISQHYYQSARSTGGIYQPKHYSSISDFYSISSYYMDTINIETLKSYVDKAVADKTLFILLSHGHDSGKLAKLIDYAQEKGCEIVTYSEAINRILNETKVQK